MSEGMKDLIFTEEKEIDREPRYRLINWLTKSEIERIAWSLDYENVNILKRKKEEAKRR